MRKSGKPLFNSEEEAKKACFELVDRLSEKCKVVVTKNPYKWYEVEFRSTEVVWYNSPIITADSFLNLKVDNEQIVVSHLFDWDS